MNLDNKVAVVTGGAGGIGQAICVRLASEQVKAIGVVDQAQNTEAVCQELNNRFGQELVTSYRGDVTDSAFREHVFGDLEARFGVVSVCVPGAGIVRDRLCVKIPWNGETSSIDLYPDHDFRRVLEVNLLAPIYWAMRMTASVGRDRARRGLKAWTSAEPIQGTIVLIGSVASAGNRGQISYATAKSGLNGAQVTLAKEAIYYGVRCTIIHPGFTDTPMARALGDRMIEEEVLSRSLLGRLIKPEEIAEAVCFLLKNPAITGQLWADAGWHPAR